MSLALIHFFFSFFSRCPSFQSFSLPTETFTFRKKNSSNQVTSVPRWLVVVVGNVRIHVYVSGTPCRDHQIEDPSKDWDKGDDSRWRDVPLRKVLQANALRLPGHLCNSKQRATEALNVQRTHQHPHFLSQTSLFSHRKDATPVEFWPREDSLSWPSSSTSLDAALHAASGVTDGERNNVDVLLFTMASLFGSGPASRPFVPFIFHGFCSSHAAFISAPRIFLRFLHSTQAPSGVTDWVEVKYYCSAKNPC